MSAQEIVGFLETNYYRYEQWYEKWVRRKVVRQHPTLTPRDSDSSLRVAPRDLYFPSTPR